MKQICKSSKQKSWHKYIEEITYDTPIAQVWKRFKSVNTSYEPQTYPIEENNKLILDSKEKANKFAEHFIANGKVGKHIETRKLPTLAEPSEDEDYNKDIEMEELEMALKLKKKTSPGIDNIPYQLLSALKDEQKIELLNIMNTSWGTGKIPNRWKSGIIIPIKKPDKMKSRIDSYRPIMLLPCIGKILEKILKERLEYVIENKLQSLQSYQCGFRKGQSTLDVLLRFENTIRESFKNKEICIAVYIDLKSAYDKVWRDGLLYKIQRAGIGGRMKRWLDDYLQNRTFRVEVEGEASDSFDLKTGVPQGAILSPLLFNMMLADLPEQDDVKKYVYADDITITCSNKNILVAKKGIQNYLKKLLKWSEYWGLEINPGKTKLQHFTLKRQKSPIIRLNNHVIEYKKTQKLLGIIFDSPKLKFTEHIKYLITNCTKRVNILKALSSTYWGASTKYLKQFYIAFIKSKIMYGIELYGAANEQVIEKLEKVQNASMRLILGARRTSPIISLQAETNIPPIKLVANYRATKVFYKTDE